MLKLRDIVTAGIVALAIFVSAFSCTAQQKRDAKTALDFTQTLCILANTAVEPVEIAVLCAIDAVAVPEIERFLSAHRQASARELSARGPASASASPSSAPPALPPASAAPSSSATPKPAASVPPAASSAPANDNATAPAKKKRAK